MSKLLQKQADTIRFLAADMVQNANSGHPGAPMGMADIVTVLSKYLSIDPENSKWINRDRIVFSGGHASAMVYSLLHLWGFDVSLEDLKKFRQVGSKTPGHPEYKHTDGVEITTGPLGQGIANAVGFAMASKYAEFCFNSDHNKIIDHHVYCLCGDGDLQEGISYEALSTLGHHQISNFTLIYDSNNITIEGSIDTVWSEDVVKRFEAIGFDIIEIDGHDFTSIDSALKDSRNSSKPTIIIANTMIAKGSSNLEGSHHTHGAPLGVDEINMSKLKAGFQSGVTFQIDDDVKNAFNKKGTNLAKNWEFNIVSNPILNKQYKLLQSFLELDISKIVWPEFEVNSMIATRDSNHQILNAIAKDIPGFMGGSADLAPSNKTELIELGDFPKGRNLHFGIKEHSMAAITNAMNLYGLFRVFNATFFIFSDYLKPAARVAAISQIPNYFIWTHDSIGVGEDGATHQPIEQLSAFRAMPNFYTFRPADASENVKCWKKALTMQNSPTGFVLSRQKLQTLKPEKAFGDVDNGGYLLKERTGATVTLLASGSEVLLALQSACLLEDKYNIKANIVSVPCFDILCEQEKSYIDNIIKPNTFVIAIEMSNSMEWYKFANSFIGIESFGQSGPAEELFDVYGFTTEKISKKIIELIK